MSTASTASSEGVTPGIPPASQSIRPPPKVFMNTNIPDISQPNPELPIQIVRLISSLISPQARPLDPSKKKLHH